MVAADGAAVQADGGVAEHARFFDHLVELVPAKYYYDDDASRMNPRHLAKAAREALKADVKFKAKLAKRERLDPDKAATTLEVQRRKKQEASGQQDKGAAGADGDQAPATTSGKQGAKPVGGKGAAKGAAGSAKGDDKGAQQNGSAAAGLQLQLSGGSLSRQELLERLHKKVEEARQQRKAADDRATQAREWRQKALEGNVASKQQQQAKAGGKRKAGDGQGEEAGAKAGGKQQGQGQKQGKQQQGQGQGPASKKARKEGGAGGEEGADLKFARIEVEGADRDKKGPGSRKPPKAVLLKQAEARKAELEALAGTEEGKAKAQQAAWKAALARAAGEKVLDDPKLLRKSLKREMKRKEKHGKAWQERVASQQEAQAARQAKRAENLAARRQTKLDNKKAKREKKLLRPGFEGRKEGFISGGGGGAKAAAS